MSWWRVSRPPGRVGGAFTKRSLMADLRRVGLKRGQIVLVHTSLRSIGPIADGAGTLLAALRAVLGRGGTIVVPTFTSWNSTTSRVDAANIRGMTESDIRSYRHSLPAFDPDTTPSLECGWFTEKVRVHRRAVRSVHPQSSFAALGRDARWLMADHDPANHLGERSPLAKLYERDARVLLIGVGFEKCTAFHLAEYRYTPSPPHMEYSCVIKTENGPQWWTYEDVALIDNDFDECGRAMTKVVEVVEARIGLAKSRCFSLAAAVDFAETWLRENRLDDLDGISPSTLTAGNQRDFIMGNDQVGARETRWPPQEADRSHHTSS